MGFDESLAFKRDPYRFIAKRCRQIASDVYETRLFLRKTSCVTGRAAAKLFYDGEKFVRHGAAPEPLQKTLLGVGGVQSLDGAAHQHRKAMFLALMTSVAFGNSPGCFARNCWPNCHGGRARNTSSCMTRSSRS